MPPSFFHLLPIGDARRLGEEEHKILRRERHHRKRIEVQEPGRVKGALDQVLDSDPTARALRVSEFINPTRIIAISSKSAPSS